jgi:hypothetical protein
VNRVLRSALYLPVFVALGCSSSGSPSAVETWTIRLVDNVGDPLGVIRLEFMAETSEKSCILGHGPLHAGRVLEKPELQGPARIADSALIARGAGRFAVDLSPDWCDANVVLEGTLAGSEARGDLLFALFGGMGKAGTFVAQRR